MRELGSIGAEEEQRNNCDYCSMTIITSHRCVKVGEAILSPLTNSFTVFLDNILEIQHHRLFTAECPLAEKAGRLTKNFSNE